MVEDSDDDEPVVVLVPVPVSQVLQLTEVSPARNLRPRKSRQRKLCTLMSLLCMLVSC